MKTYCPASIRARDVSRRKPALRVAGRDWTASNAVDVSSSRLPVYESDALGMMVFTVREQKTPDYTPDITIFGLDLSGFCYDARPRPFKKPSPAVLRI